MNLTLALLLSALSSPTATAARVSGEREAALGELRASPARHLGQDVRFAFQFRAVVEDWDPLLSRFDPEAWVGFEAWADEAFTWDPEVFEAPARRLFVRRGSASERVLRGASVYQRFEACAVVRELFLGEPWLEVVDLTPLDGEVGEGTIVAVGRARELACGGQFDLALEQYDRARAAPLPPHALAAILREMQSVRQAQEHLDRERKPDKAAPKKPRPPG